MRRTVRGGKLGEIPLNNKMFDHTFSGPGSGVEWNPSTTNHLIYKFISMRKSYIMISHTLLLCKGSVRTLAIHLREETGVCIKYYLGCM